MADINLPYSEESLSGVTRTDSIKNSGKVISLVISGLSAGTITIAWVEGSNNYPSTASYTADAEIELKTYGRTVEIQYTGVTANYVSIA